MVKLIYHGHSCWELASASRRVIIDPFLTGNPRAAVKPDDFEKMDAIIVTHGHGDHLGDVPAIANKTGAIIISNFEIANYFEAQGWGAHGLHIGGGHDFPFGRVKLTIAHHGSSGPNGEYLGNPAGVVLTMDGTRVYHAGDTGLFLDMKLIAEMNGPLDAALLPIGDNFTMGIDDAVKAAEFLDAGITIPMHYNTFPVIEADPDEFAGKVEATGRKAVVVAPGESWDVG
jgi:L-ascorbate metabolism protein UlaG (beta-lactamase superfamily)